MPMQMGEVLSPWTGTGTESDANRPLVAETHAVDKWQDVTGQPSENLKPDPNNYVVYIEADSLVMDAIAADNALYLLWAEDIPGEVI